MENTGQIESYLTAMRNVLKEENDAEELISVSADSLQQMLFAQARQMAEAKHLPIEVVRMEALSQTEAKFRIRKVQILRAWENLVGNALEYTDPMRCMEHRNSTGGTTVVMTGVIRGLGLRLQNVLSKPKEENWN